MLVYNAVINTVSCLVNAIGATVRQKHPRKFFRFVYGRRNLLKHIADTYKKDSRPTVWIHSASFGEYSVARPIINALRAKNIQVVATFFSPSGYEAVKGSADVDYVYYLPIDTERNAKQFLDIIRPDKAVFIVSEYWFNFLSELSKRDIDTYLVSARITPKSVFFKWYGGLYRRCLKIYKHIFVVDEASKHNVEGLGCTAVTCNGNPLFDNAIEKAATDWSNPIIERFARGNEVFIAGSIHDDNDLNMVTDLANRHHDVKFIMVPHETGPEATQRIKEALRGKALAYSECDANTDFSDTQAIIIDFVGALAYIYRYAQWAYVGGGFTKYLHSLIEATVYGLPVSFGPMTLRKVTPEQIVERGIGEIVTDSAELDQWFCNLRQNPELMAEISEKARKYVATNAGATQRIINEIFS